jgi:hypothetical protein
LLKVTLGANNLIGFHPSDNVAPRIQKFLAAKENHVAGQQAFNAFMHFIAAKSTAIYATFSISIISLVVVAVIKVVVLLLLRVQANNIGQYICKSSATTAFHIHPFFTFRAPLRSSSPRAAHFSHSFFLIIFRSSISIRCTRSARIAQLVELT